MFLFIGLSSGTLNGGSEFKYILCSYLSLLMLKKKDGKRNLNTSYVLIYLCRHRAYIGMYDYLNTSYVLIYRCRFFKLT